MTNVGGVFTFNKRDEVTAKKQKTQSILANNKAV